MQCLFTVNFSSLSNEFIQEHEIPFLNLLQFYQEIHVLATLLTSKRCLKAQPIAYHENQKNINHYSNLSQTKKNTYIPQLLKINTE